MFECPGCGCDVAEGRECSFCDHSTVLQAAASRYRIALRLGLLAVLALVVVSSLILRFLFKPAADSVAPTLADPDFQKAVRLLQRGDRASAQPLLNKAIDVVPNPNIPAAFLAAEFLMVHRSHRDTESLDSAESALKKVGPQGGLPYHYFYGVLECERGQPQEGLPHFQQCNTYATDPSWRFLAKGSIFPANLKSWLEYSTAGGGSSRPSILPGL